jgi:GNAT superfamily N-acetyltransferase
MTRERSVTLADGSSVVIRPIEPDDRSTLAAAHVRLTRESQYRRYFGAKPRLSQSELDYLTRIDHREHEAIVAIDPVTGDTVGVARYVRTAPGVAEPAFVIAEEWRRRGLGSRLLDTLAERAREEAIRRFEAPVLATNREAIRTLARLGKTTLRNRGREVDVHVELGTDAAGTRDASCSNGGLFSSSSSKDRRAER